MARILDSIDSPDKLKLLTDEELSILAQEIREEIINVTSKTGGQSHRALGRLKSYWRFIRLLIRLMIVSCLMLGISRMPICSSQGA